MKVEMARQLFDTDAKSSIFSAEIGEIGKLPYGSDPNRRTVCLYPRKGNLGFLYCIWKPGVSTIGTQAIIAGGTIKTESVQRAAMKAIKTLFLVTPAAQFKSSKTPNGS